MTPAECLLWSKLRYREMLNLKFRRQHPIGTYITDFICLEKKLIIEVDGGQHMEQEKEDRVRTEYFQSFGYRVLRFWNHEVFQNIDGVIQTILKMLDE